ncbi:MAG TPA: hypothetical protein VJ917_06605 [Saprospiraceae bacterium]|nr:hypothetical protein [Saprospiraceae bacterium]
MFHRIVAAKVGRLHTYIFIIIHWCSVNTFAQSGTAKMMEAVQKEKRPAYIDIAVGLNISSFRDFATSPLIYSGKPIYTALSHIDMDEKRESHFTLSYSFGKYQSDVNQHTSESKVNTFGFNYLELFQLKQTSNSKLNVKIGGQLNATANHRENSELFNNSEGLDIIATLFGSARVTLNLSRSKGKTRKCKQTLTYTMNIGVVNSSFRNGFAYTSPSTPLNNDDFFAGYEWQLFKGFRLDSALDYTVFLYNKNALQVSYSWDAYRTAGHHDNFEMTAHILNLSLLFGLQ